ncbi:hypothetical protein [uncultured Brevundimonas sp.]|uniref:hypothetical protein n=1 Tax=uncultured Brevundimonas sp. TaxID=213418 RepID=UPI002620E886|nr:hypothetical protein [uncultured Brevundimonas sp.]
MPRHETPHPVFDPLDIDPEDWATPDHLTEDECFDALGSDWRCASVTINQGDEE